MKTKLTTIFKKSANTPPMWVCLLFALVISTNCWATVVTAEWGDYTTPATGFPYGTYQEINGIKITPCATLASDPNVFIDGHNCHNYQLNTTGKYFDITLSSGYITQVKCNVWTANNTLLKIQFSKKSPYDSNDLTGDPIPLHDANREAPTSMLTVNAPSDAKSARIYKDGSNHWQCYLYRLIVTASTGCDSPETASFAASGAGISGSAPSNINACAGGEFIIPNAGTLAKSGYDFVGWNDGSTTKSPGDSYIMPADGVTFTAEWNPHYVPAVTDLNSSVSGDDVTISWTNYNKLNTPSVSFADAALNNYSTTNGTLSCNYTHAGGWAGPCLELSLPRSMNHVTSIDMEYYHTNSANSSGGIITYLKSGVEDAKGKWFDNSDDAHIYLTKTAEYTDIQIVPRAILWSTTSNAYSSDYHIGILGFACNLASESTGSFSIKDIYINTSDNQTTLDEIKIIRKKGSAPTSISDGTQVYSGILNTFTDNDLADGTYYYAVYAREGDSYSIAVVEGPIRIGDPTMRSITEGSHTNGSMTITDGTDAIPETMSGETVYITATPNTGYEFSEWDIYKTGDSSTKIILNDDDDTDGSTRSFTMPAYGVTIDVTFAPKTYTITMASNNEEYGTVSAANISSVPYASTVSIADNVLTLNETDVTATPADATDEYTYAFSNWSVSNGASITEDQTITANFTQTAKEYTLAWNTNGGSDLAGDPTSGNVAYGTTLTMPTDPTLSNYAFDGWKTTNDGTGTAAGLTMPAANTTYYAAWKQTLTLNTGLQGSGADKTDAYVYLNGAEVNNFTAHTVDGYTLKGYYTATSAGTKVLNEDGTFAATNVADYIAEGKWIRTNATTLYAVWKRNKTVAEWGSYETATYSFALGESGTGIVLNIPSGIDVGSYYLSGNNRNGCRFDENEYVDISIATGRIASVSAYVWTKSSVDKFYIQFCSETDYNTENLIGDPIEWTGTNTSNPTLLTAIPAQTDAKSARIYRTGHGDANNFLYRLIVTASPECISPLTASFELGEGASGTIPDNISACEDDDIVLPSIGTARKPFCTFNGWSDGINVYDAGDVYSMSENDVTFTAQWTEDNTTKRIPETPSLYYANIDGGSTDTEDFNNETCVYLYTTHYAEWNAYITPGFYDISLMYGAPKYGIRGTFSIIDPEGIEETRVFHTQPEATNDTKPICKNIEKSKVDLTGLTRGKVYTIKVEHNWSGSRLSIGHINFAFCAPKEIPDETHFDKDNAFSAVTTATDMDIDGEAGNDELINLDRKYVEWDVKVTPGVYNVSLVYGAPQYSIKVSVALIDPENPASVIYLSKEGNNTYYYKSGSQNTSHHYTSTTRCDLTEIDGNKTYRLHISDEYNGSNYLRVKDLTFASVAPISIVNDADTRLDATNTILPPTMATDLDIDDDSNVDNLMNLYNTNAEWQVTLQKGLYDVQLVYGAPDYGIKVAVKLIDPSGEEPDKVLSIEDNKDYYYKSNPAATEEEKATTPHHYTSATKCALLDVTEDKIYKVRVEDVYPKCNLRVSHVLFTPIAPVEIHEEATLNASNVMVAPSIVDSRIDIRNQQEAVWYATIDQHKYDINLQYRVSSGCSKVRVIIQHLESGDVIFEQQQDKCDADNTVYTFANNAQDFTSIASGTYKITVKDNYGENGSKPQIISLTFSRAMVTHTRTGLTVGNYGTICLPYAVAAEDIHGADIFDMQGWPAGSVAVVLNEVDNMEAGRPYVIQAKATTATWSYYPEGDEAEAGSHNGLIGSYTKEVIPANENNYMVYKNKLYYVDVLSYVGANKAYINRNLAEAAAEPVAPAPGKRQIRLFLDGEQVITDIDQINDQMTNTKYMENGILYILREGKVYNAQGQLVK